MIVVGVALYVIVAAWLSLYGFNLLTLSLVYLFRRKRQGELHPLSDYAHVTVQLPVFNERHVVERVIDAAAAFDWPLDKLHIQVLDDSTDDTTNLARARAEFHSARGVDITVLHRTDRTGYKAGALQAGLACSTSPFVAIFDADFCPAPDFLKRMMPSLNRPDVGWAQARWTHLNQDYSLLTGAMSLPLDAHFAVEQVARAGAGFAMIFNGSAGVWRRAAIDAAGGWQGDTLTEDADLSLRAQMAGWRGVMRPDVTVLSELPVQIGAIKQQYFRWAKGGGETLRKLFIPVARARMPFWKKATALFLLSSYMVPPLVMLLLATWLPVILRPELLNGAPTALIGIATLAVPFEFLLGQIIIHRGNVRRIIYLPVFMVIATGMALNSARGVVQGLAGRRTEFMRTPKFRMENRQESWKRSAYVLTADPTAFGEALMAGYAVFMIIEAWRAGNVAAIPILTLYAAGFACVALGSAVDLRPRRKGSPLRAKADA